MSDWERESNYLINYFWGRLSKPLNSYARRANDFLLNELRTPFLRWGKYSTDTLSFTPYKSGSAIKRDLLFPFTALPKTLIRIVTSVILIAVNLTLVYFYFAVSLLSAKSKFDSTQPKYNPAHDPGNRALLLVMRLIRLITDIIFIPLFILIVPFHICIRLPIRLGSTLFNGFQDFREGKKVRMLTAAMMNAKSQLETLTETRALGNHLQAINKDTEIISEGNEFLTKQINSYKSLSLNNINNLTRKIIKALIQKRPLKFTEGNEEKTLSSPKNISHNTLMKLYKLYCDHPFDLVTKDNRNNAFRNLSSEYWVTSQEQASLNRLIENIHFYIQAITFPERSSSSSTEANYTPSERGIIKSVKNPRTSYNQLFMGPLLKEKTPVETKTKAPVETKTPEALVKEISEHYIGNPEAVKSLATSAFHFQDIKSTSLFIIGNSASGKTLLVKTLAEKLDRPFATVNCGNITRAGIIGPKVTDWCEGLVNKVGKKKAEQAVVFFDEICKLKKEARSGDGRSGAQNGIIAMIEPNTDIKYSTAYLTPPKKLSNKNMIFVFAGTFSGIDAVIKKRLKFQLTGKQLPTKDDLIQYGMKEDLLNRLGTPIRLQPINDITTMRKIIHTPNSTLSKYKGIFSRYNATLEMSNDAESEICSYASKKNNGARGLSIFNDVFKDTAYRLPSRATEKPLVIKLIAAQEKMNQEVQDNNDSVETETIVFPDCLTPRVFPGDGKTLSAEWKNLIPENQLSTYRADRAERFSDDRSFANTRNGM